MTTIYSCLASLRRLPSQTCAAVALPALLGATVVVGAVALPVANVVVQSIVFLQNAQYTKRFR